MAEHGKPQDKKQDSYTPSAREFLILTEDVKAIRRALLGDEFSTGSGLVARFDALSSRVEVHDTTLKRVKWMIIGAITLGALLGLGINELVISLLMGGGG